VIRSRTTRQFREQLARLPKPIQQSARKAYRLWVSNPDHPSLSFKKLEASSLYSVRVAYRWRAVAYREDETFVWFFIGPHSAYDKLGKG
jgi:hypothetical protein